MSKTGKSTWFGKSGTGYGFTDYGLDTSFSDGVKGNYIFSRRTVGEDGKTFLVPLYIGEGVIWERTEYRIREGRVQEKGCNCVSVRVAEHGEDSKQIETDLLAFYVNAYEPAGCNIKEGG
jgi:hypothetical protein